MTEPTPEPDVVEYRVWPSSLSLVPLRVDTEERLIAVLAAHPTARGEYRVNGGDWLPYTPPEPAQPPVEGP